MAKLTEGSYRNSKPCKRNSAAPVVPPPAARPQTSSSNPPQMPVPPPIQLDRDKSLSSFMPLALFMLIL